MSPPRTTLFPFRTEIVALALVVGLGGTAAAGPFEDGLEALKRGDQATAAQLLGPLAEKGDTRAQLALGVGPAVKGYRPPPSISVGQIELVLIAFVLAVGGIGYARQMFKIQNLRARRAEFVRKLPPEVRAEFERAKQIAKERPWEPIAMSLDSLRLAENGMGVRFHASGDHLGHPFGFAFALTMSHGPVAICEWSRDGAASEGLIDILAHYAGISRGDCRFDNSVKTTAIILKAEPPDVPFAQIIRFHCKIFFELAENNPEIYFYFDLAGKTGAISEKDPMHRKSLVHAFEVSDQREEIAP